MLFSSVVRTLKFFTFGEKRHLPIFTTHLIVVSVFISLPLVAKDKSPDSETDSSKFDDVANLSIHLVVVLAIIFVLVVPYDIPSHLQVVLVTVVLNSPVVE